MRFPALLTAQRELLVQAMACGLSRVGLIQASHHTTDLLMSRFPGTEMERLGQDMRSHEASHYGAAHNEGDPKFLAYLAQRRWWLQEFRALLDALAARPEGEGSMLDYSLVLLCTEVCDGNTHLHDDMPFILAGGQGAGLRGGALLQRWGRRHGDLYVSLAQAMGAPMDRFGQGSQGPLGLFA